MFEFKVLGISEAGVEFFRGWPTMIVSAIKPIPEFVSQGDHHLIVDVDDIHSIVCEGTPATAEMVEEVLAFTANLNDHDRLVVHCYAGQSRSTALMIGILIQHGLAPQEAFDAVKANRDVLMPNQLITELLDAHFNLGGALVKIVLDYVSAELQRMRTSCNDKKVTATQVSSMAKIMDMFKDL